MENRASLAYRSMCEKVNEVDLNEVSIEAEYDESLSANFKRLDRRRLVAAPASDRAEFLEQLRSWTQISGEQPRWNLKETLETVGDRLACCRLAIEFSDGTGSEQIQILLFNHSVAQLELIVSFDAEDDELARAELHRLAHELASGSQQGPRRTRSSD